MITLASVPSHFKMVSDEQYKLYKTMLSIMCIRYSDVCIRMGKCVFLLTKIFATHFHISTKQIDLQTLKSIEQTKNNNNLATFKNHCR